MTFEQSKLQCVPFGKFKGKTIDVVARADILYLDWLFGRDLRDGPFKDALTVYMKDESIQKEVQQAIQDKAYARQQWR